MFVRRRDIVLLLDRSIEDDLLAFGVALLQIASTAFENLNWNQWLKLCNLLL